MSRRLPTIHPTAEVEAGASIGRGTRVWHQAQVRRGASIGAACVLGKGTFVDSGVVIGPRTSLQNYACVYGPARIGRRVLLGPHAVVANCRFPRVNCWNCPDDPRRPVVVDDDASIGAHAVVLPGVHIGRYATVGAGAVVTEDVPDRALVYGVPARVVGCVCRCGRPVEAGRRTCGPCARRRCCR